MDIRELATYKWGVKDVRTVAVHTVFEQMGEAQATLLYCYLCDGSEAPKSSEMCEEDPYDWDDDGCDWVPKDG